MFIFNGIQRFHSYIGSTKKLFRKLRNWTILYFFNAHFYLRILQCLFYLFHIWIIINKQLCVFSGNTIYSRNYVFSLSVPTTSYAKNPDLWQTYNDKTNIHLIIGSGSDAVVSTTHHYLEPRMHFWAIQLLKMLFWSGWKSIQFEASIRILNRTSGGIIWVLFKLGGLFHCHFADATNSRGIRKTIGKLLIFPKLFVPLTSYLRKSK